MKRKLKREELKINRKAWRSQIDFSQDFFRKATKEEVFAFNNFFKKYDHYCGQIYSFMERNRFSRDKVIHITSWVLIEGFSFKTTEKIERYVNELLLGSEEKINRYMKNKFGNIVRLIFNNFFKIVAKDDGNVKLVHRPDYYFLSYWIPKYEDRIYSWDWVHIDKDDNFNLYNSIEEQIWSKKPSLLDVVKSFGVKEPEKITSNIRNMSGLDIAKDIVDLMGGEEKILEDIKKIVPEGDREVWKEEDRRAEEAERKRIESLDDDKADVYFSAKKPIKFN